MDEPKTNDPQATSAADLSQIFDQMAEKIIEQQEAIIGPVAVERAKQVRELKIDWPRHEVDVTGDPTEALEELVDQFKELFGQIAVETCKEAIARFASQVPADKLPKSLQ